MSSNNIDILFNILGILETTAAAGIFLYSAYWGLAIRRALIVPLYRRQALWVSIIGIYFALLFLDIAYANPFASSNPYIFYSGGLLFFTGFVLIFAWTDGTVRVARRSDPLLRDTLHWTKLRVIIWAGIFLGILAFIGILIRLIVAGSPISDIENGGFIVAILAILLSGSPALFVSARRSRDTTLRRHLRWFELFASILIASSVIGYAYTVFGTHSGAPAIISAGVGYTTFIVAAYSLYKSARSLAPIGRLPRIESQLISTTSS
jgi:hypothetical protein